MWECPSTYPAGGSFTLSFATSSGSVATLWIMCSPLVECLRNKSGSTLGVLDDLWHLLNHDSCLSWVPCVNVTFQEEFYNWAHVCKGGFSIGFLSYLVCSLWWWVFSPSVLSWPQVTPSHSQKFSSSPSAEGEHTNPAPENTRPPRANLARADFQHSCWAWLFLWMDPLPQPCLLVPSGGLSHDPNSHQKVYLGEWASVVTDQQLLLCTVWCNGQSSSVI